jgi:restriction system protein
MTDVWVVRTGKHGERDAWALENGLTGGGWFEAPDLATSKSREEVADVVRSVYLDSSPGGQANYTGQLWALCGRIKVGDVMVLPLKTTGQVAFGYVTEPYRYDSVEPDPSRRHQLKIKWERVDVARTAIKQDLLYIIGSALTIFKPSRNDAAWRLEQILRDGIDPGARVDTSTIASEFNNQTSEELDSPITMADISDFAMTTILTRVQETFKGHDLARLIEGILVAEGYHCERKVAGPDGGVDILAGSGPLGLDSPRIVVQVKSDSGTVGDPVVQTLQGAIKRFGADQALLVAWGGVNRNAEKFLETEKFSIRVWNSEEVLKAMFRNYDRLPAEIRAELPLQQIWIPVD